MYRNNYFRIVYMRTITPHHTPQPYNVRHSFVRRRQAAINQCNDAYVGCTFSHRCKTHSDDEWWNIADNEMISDSICCKMIGSGMRKGVCHWDVIITNCIRFRWRWWWGKRNELFDNRLLFGECDRESVPIRYSQWQHVQCIVNGKLNKKKSLLTVIVTRLTLLVFVTHNGNRIMWAHDIAARTTVYINSAPIGKRTRSKQ